MTESKISSSFIIVNQTFESNIKAIQTLNHTIGCIADEHDSNVEREIQGHLDKAFGNLITKLEEKKKKKQEEKEQEEEQKLSEEEKKKLLEELNFVFSEYVATHEKDTYHTVHKLRKRNSSKQGPILRRGALVTLLGCFETLIARLIKEFYNRYPKAFPSDAKTITLDELKQMGSVKDAEKYLIDMEIDSILRGNIASQLSYFKKPINITTKPLDNFIDALIELSQRRNILVHNDGFVNRHYISKTPVSMLPDGINEGDCIEVDQSYLSKAIETIYCSGIILIQQCYRKWDKKDTDVADSLLIESSFEALIDENYTIPILLSNYSNSIKMNSEANKRIVIINHGIALRNSGLKEKMDELLSNYDWTAVSLPFQLALLALEEDEDEFYQVLKKAIAADEVKCEQLIDWPLFKPYTEKKTFNEIIDENWPNRDVCYQDTEKCSTQENPAEISEAQSSAPSTV